MTLKTALAWSVLLHLGLMAVHPPEGLVPSPESLHTIEVTYLAMKKQAPSGAHLKTPSISESMAQASDPSPKEPRPLPSSPPPVLDLPKPPPLRSPESPPVRPPSLTQKGRSSGAFHLPEREFAVVEHKRLVRDHLKRHLRYPATWIQGTVRLKVTLDPSGSLRQAVVSDAADPLLATACLEGANSANPYPRFLKTMKESEAAYEFLVQYRSD